MVEPHQKRVKLPPSKDCDNISASFPKTQLEVIHLELRKKCLCKLQLAEILHSLTLCNEFFSSQHVGRLSHLRQETLLYTSMLSLFFEVSLKQQSKGIVCARISEVVAAGADNEGAVVDILFGLLALEDKYISYSAGRTISALLLMLRGSACQFVLEKLSENIAQSSNLLEVGHSINVIKRIIEWKDVDEHPLEGHDSEGSQPANCLKITLSPADTEGANEVKYVATKKLESKWFILVSRLTHHITQYSMEKQHVIVSFLSLWESLISVKANLSITDTKEFYSGLERLLTLLTHQTHYTIWRKVLDLYNEVLCYGSTLALQDILAEEPCSLAHLIIRAVKDRRFLECVPWGSPAVTGHRRNDVSGSSATDPLSLPCSSSSYNSLNSGFSEELGCTMTSGNCDKTIMHKVVLLVFKAIAVTVKETRCDSSSENSSRSGGSGSEDVDMAIIERSLREVLKKLDIFVKGKLPYHPESPMSEWMVRLFADQDDWLVESMVCGLDIYTGLGLRLRHSELQSCVNPHETFGVFVETIYLDPDVLLDLLVSNETCFLLYLLRYLKLLRRDWTSFGHGRKPSYASILTLYGSFSVATYKSVSLFAPYPTS
ncbi:Protein lines [Armadillidium nasatum]|uniref:Protein lines n=1 Tax=Armadillidium nasatum TaxID=96803 RepID=A0A5N5T7P5_9CRUS|nr:Protein lines [Armadillidium nasatum]